MPRSASPSRAGTKPVVEGSSAAAGAHHILAPKAAGVNRQSTIDNQQSILDRPDPAWVERGRLKAAITQQATAASQRGEIPAAAVAGGKLDVPRNSHKGLGTIPPEVRLVVLGHSRFCVSCGRFTRCGGACPGVLPRVASDVPICHSSTDAEVAA